MPLVSPKQIADKAKKAYPRFLEQWIRGEGESFFPYRVRLKLTVDPDDIRGTIAANQKLQTHSKAERGWGYTVHREQIRKQNFGNNLFPKSITLDEQGDLLREKGRGICRHQACRRSGASRTATA